MPNIEYRRVSRVNRLSAYLLDAASDVTSQCGEDGILARIFEIVGERSRWCVEFGAWDGKKFSNTFNLMQQGWSGVFIEGNEDRFAELQKTYADTPRAYLICGIVGFDPAGNSLEHYLKQTPIPVDFDILSIDIDGNDWHVWKSLVEYRPRVVIVEFNPTIANDVLFVQDRDPAINQGCSLLALIELGKSNGYELIAATAWNAIFVVREEFGRFGITDNGIEAMYDDRYAGRIFHGYDGTIFTVGMEQLLWHGRRIEHDEIQVLPKRERVYGDSIHIDSKVDGDRFRLNHAIRSLLPPWKPGRTKR